MAESRPLESVSPMPVSFFAPEGAVLPKFRVLCFGDSLTAGYCSNGHEFEPYGRTLVKELSILLESTCEVLVAGFCGFTTADMAASWDEVEVEDVVNARGKGLGKVLETERLDLVILMSGTNDMANRISPEVSARRVASLHRLCHESGVPTVLLAPPGVPGWTPGSGIEWARQQLAQLLFMNAEPLIKVARDVSDFIDREVEDYWELDRLHFSPAGSRLLGQQLAQVIAPLLANGEATATASDKSQAAGPKA